jgi:hypothetical protein
MPIRADPARRLAAIDVKHDIVADQPLEHACDPSGDVAQVMHAELQHLPPAEGEKLLGQRSRPFAGFKDLIDAAGVATVLQQLASKKISLAGDHGQEVVEVVGDTSSEAPDGFHLLRL